MTWLTVICLPLGLLLILMSFFLLEPEERKIRDTVERWWITIDDYETTWIDRTILLTRSVAKMINVWLDEMFGRRAISLRALVTCLAFSLASLLLLSAGFGVYTWFKPVTTPIPLARVVGCLFGGGLLFFVVTRKRNNKHSEAMLSITTALILGGTTAFFAGTSGRQVGLYLGLLCGVMCNYAVLLLARRLASWGSGTSHWVFFVGFAFLNAIVGLGLLIAPMLLMNTGRMYGIGADLVGFTAITNLFSGVIAASFMLSALALFVQKASWPMISRPIYAMDRFQIFQKRKWLFLAGCSLVSLGIPGLAVAIQTTLSLFG